MDDVAHQHLIDFLTAAVLSGQVPKTHADLIIMATRERWEAEDWMDEAIVGSEGLTTSSTTSWSLHLWMRCS